jgi:hypothetical protein
MRRLLVALVVLAATVAPAGAVSRTGLHGTVMRGPTRPVCLIGQPCDEPAAGVTLVFTRNGSERRVRTGQLGGYRIALAPGAYSVRVGPSPRIGRGLEPRSVRVRVGTFRRIDFMIDTGIR